MLYPEMFGDELAFQDKFTLCVVAAVPVPVRACVVVVGEALLVTVRVAFTVPVTCGLNVIVYGTLWPAAIVTGRLRPPMVNTELFVVAAVTITFATLAVRLPEALLLLPT